jgi:hypothetical protein
MGVACRYINGLTDCASECVGDLDHDTQSKRLAC